MNTRYWALFLRIAIVIITTACSSFPAILPLRIDGKEIRNSADEKITLQCININDFMEHSYNNWGQGFASTISWIHTAGDFTVIKKIGFNCVRCNIGPTHIDSMNMQRLKDIVQWSNDAGVYLIIAYFAPPGSVAWNGYYSEKGFWSSQANQDKYIGHWQAIMDYCQTMPHVLYEFLNEPQIAYTNDIVNDPAFSPYTTRLSYANLCKKMLDYNKTHGNKVCIIDGLGYASAYEQGFKYLERELSGYGNIVYSFHYYMTDFVFRKCNWGIDSTYKYDTGFSETNPGWDTIRFSATLQDTLKRLDISSERQAGKYRIKSCMIQNGAATLFSFDFTGKSISGKLITDAAQGRSFELVCGGVFESAKNSDISYENSNQYVVIANTVPVSADNPTNNAYANLVFHNRIEWTGAPNINFPLHTPLQFTFVVDGESVDDFGNLKFQFGRAPDSLHWQSRVVANLKAWDKDTLFYKGKMLTSHVDRITASFRTMRQVADSCNRPVFLGEFGVPLIQKEPLALRYFNTIRQLCIANNFHWSYFVFREMFPNNDPADKNKITFSLFSGWNATVKSIIENQYTGKTSSQIGKAEYFYNQPMINNFVKILGGIFDTSAVQVKHGFAPTRMGTYTVSGYISYSRIILSIRSNENSSATIKLFNARGSRICSLTNTRLSAGENRICLPVENKHTGKGVYFIRINSGSFHAVRKIVF